MTAGIDATFEKLRQDGAIKVEVVNLAGDAANAAAEQQAMAMFKDQILSTWFTPSLSPTTAAAADAGVPPMPGQATAPAASGATTRPPTPPAGGHGETTRKPDDERQHATDEGRHYRHDNTHDFERRSAGRGQPSGRERNVGRLGDLSGGSARCQWYGELRLSSCARSCARARNRRDCAGAGRSRNGRDNGGDGSFSVSAGCRRPSGGGRQRRRRRRRGRIIGRIGIRGFAQAQIR